MTSTVIISPQKTEREKITSLLGIQKGVKVLAQGKDGYDALKLIGSLKPDIAVLDTHLEFIRAEEIPPLLRARSPLTAIVILIAQVNDYQLFRAAANKVSGFVYKETDLYKLPEIIECISGGGCFISPVLAARILRLLNVQGQSVKNPPDEKQLKFTEDVKFSAGEDPAGYLSKMELHIVTCVGEGYTSDEIARDLDLAVGTVRNYVSIIMRKIGLHNRSQMVRYAYNYGLVPHPF